MTQPGIEVDSAVVARKLADEIARNGLDLAYARAAIETLVAQRNQLDAENQTLRANVAELAVDKTEALEVDE